MEDKIKIGIIGAGENTRKFHIPNFQKLDGVEVVSVCNRSRESGQKVADEFTIQKVFSNLISVLEYFPKPLLFKLIFFLFFLFLSMYPSID